MPCTKVCALDFATSPQKWGFSAIQEYVLVLVAWYRIVMCLALKGLPGRLRGWMFRVLLGWEVHHTARIGLCLIDVRHRILGADARIGHFNVFRNLVYARLEDCSIVGQWNWITAAKAFLGGANRGNLGCFIVGRHTGISSRHYLDCSGGLEIGGFTTLAGVRQTILTHQISASEACQTVKGVRIGSYCLISSNVAVAPGSVIPDHSLIAMGAVVAGELEQSGMLWAGIPAKPIKYVGSGRYFSRLVGFVEVDEFTAHLSANRETM